MSTASTKKTMATARLPYAQKPPPTAAARIVRNKVIGFMVRLSRSVDRLRHVSSPDGAQQNRGSAIPHSAALHAGYRLPALFVVRRPIAVQRLLPPATAGR